MFVLRSEIVQRLSGLYNDQSFEFSLWACVNRSLSPSDSCRFADYPWTKSRSLQYPFIWTWS